MISPGPERALLRREIEFLGPHSRRYPKIILLGRIEATTNICRNPSNSRVGLKLTGRCEFLFILNLDERMHHPRSTTQIILEDYR